MTMPYRYGGARVLVEMHDETLRQFLDTWRQADSLDVALPETNDPNYASREVLLAHVMGCATRYLLWMCEHLGEPLPMLEARPKPEGFADRADAYLETVLKAWQGPALRRLTEKRAYGPAHHSPWGVPYCIDAMLEHAVMHPVRHRRQLKGLMTETS